MFVCALLLPETPQQIYNTRYFRSNWHCRSTRLVSFTASEANTYLTCGPARIVTCRSSPLTFTTFNHNSLITIDRSVEARTIIRDSALGYHLDVGVDCGKTLAPAPWQRITRTPASLLHCFRAYSTSTQETLHRIDRSDTSFYEASAAVEDICHLVCHCPLYAPLKYIILNSSRSAGRPNSPVQYLLSPPVPSGSVRLIFRALLQLLELLALGTRL